MVLKVSLNTGINRIRLEFKVLVHTQFLRRFLWINRIRLEFKVGHRPPHRFRNTGLIESDWNLKVFLRHRQWYRMRINRIRLEFKGKKKKPTPTRRKGINRIRLEFKADPHRGAQSIALWD